MISSVDGENEVTVKTSNPVGSMVSGDWNYDEIFDLLDEVRDKDKQEEIGI